MGADLGRDGPSVGARWQLPDRVQYRVDFVQLKFESYFHLNLSVVVVGFSFLNASRLSHQAAGASGH